MNRSRARKNAGQKNGRARLWIWISSCLLAAALLALAIHTGLGGARQGTAAPAAQTDLVLTGARGETVKLFDHLSGPVVISFLCLEQDGIASDAQPVQKSRAQVNFIKSLYKQYEGQNVTFLLVDSSRIVSGKDTDANDRLNFTYDWSLDHIPLLIDSAHDRVAETFKVGKLPATLLLSAEGKTLKRWDDKALTSDIALALKDAGVGK